MAGKLLIDTMNTTGVVDIISMKIDLQIEIDNLREKVYKLEQENASLRNKIYLSNKINESHVNTLVTQLELFSATNQIKLDLD